VRKFRGLGGDFLPTRNALAGLLFLNRDVGGQAEQITLQRFAETCVDGERDHQRHHACRYAGDGDHRDDGDHHLLAFSSEIAEGYEKLKHYEP